MGGASTEIAFSVGQNGTKSCYHMTEKLVGQLEHLYPPSYLCYGYRLSAMVTLYHRWGGIGDRGWALVCCVLYHLSLSLSISLSLSLYLSLSLSFRLGIQL